MGGVLFRSSTPLNPGSSRAACAEAAFRAAGVTVVMNLADDPASVRNHEGYADSYYAATDSIELNMGVDFSTEDFQTKLADGLRFFAEHPGVYAVHCIEGKDRTGFVVALLELLMGASYDEAIADYMVTYYNYYGVTKDDARYEAIVNSNIVRSLRRAFGVDDLSSADLAVCAKDYIKGIGLTDAEIAALKANLSASAATAPAQYVEPDTDSPVYVVVEGDCLWNIAYSYYGTGTCFGVIAEANGIEQPYIIYIGQMLVIPYLGTANK